MKLISWNIRGCSNPRKWKTLNRKIKQENLDILFLQETKSSLEGLEKIRDKIWKGSHLMALDVVGQVGGVAILWQPRVVELSNWRANKLVLMVYFHILDSGVNGSLGNVYGPISFPAKQYFIGFLSWLKGQTEVGNWVIGGDFNIISNLGEKKGG